MLHNWCSITKTVLVSPSLPRCRNFESILENLTRQAAHLQAVRLQASRNRKDRKYIIWDQFDHFIKKCKVLSSVSFKFGTTKWICLSQMNCLGRFFFVKLSRQNWILFFTVNFIIYLFLSLLTVSISIPRALPICL